ncbi:phosphoethanolamine transferase [Teredinibacter waterburyi]|uniref:phosphoethanolamine transferase n=1 Tax=Teredinibacter waterburyi TaxID=1500538 RepID=UPI00165EDA73|nr:sulfatase-like hydrolase/transferase [Teredinibacter waterburyi]
MKTDSVVKTAAKALLRVVAFLVKVREISGFRLNLIVALAFAVVVNLKIWRIYFDKHSFAGLADVLALLAFFSFVYLLMLAVFSVFNFRWIQKPALVGFTLISAPAWYFSNRLSVLFDKSMLQNLIETNSAEALDLVSVPLIVSMVLLGLVPIALVQRLRLKHHGWLRQLSSNTITLAMCLVLAVLVNFPFYANHSSFVRNNNHTLANSLLPIAPIMALSANIKAMVRETNIVKQVMDSSAHQRTPLVGGMRKPRVYLILLGETAREKSFSLRDAGMEQIEESLLNREGLVYFSNFWPCGTSTALSIPCMFSFAGRQDYTRDMNKKYENAAELMQRVGYEVHWQENDGGCKGVCSKLINDKPNKYDAAKFANGNEYFDEILIDNIGARIKSSVADKVLFLHMEGSHGPAYYKRVPENAKRLQPACESANFTDCTAEEIVNAYNNTILYTRYLVGRTIDELQAIEDEYDSFLMYVSDHGESTGENGMYLHGVPYFMAPEEQTHVPALIWASAGFQESRGLDVSCLQEKSSFRFSHDYFSHSLLRIMQIDTTVHNPEMDFFNGCVNN